MKWNRKTKFIFIDLVLTFFLILADQFTKFLAVKNLKDQAPYIIMDGIFELRYLENRGAAFGIMQGQKLFFILISIIVLLGICYIFIKIPEEKKYNNFHYLLVLIASGAVGNMIDRIRLGYVIDFFYFILIDFPIFNMADIYVSVACVLLAILMFFVYKEEDLDFLF